MENGKWKIMEKFIPSKHHEFFYYSRLWGFIFKCILSKVALSQFDRFGVCFPAAESCDPGCFVCSSSVQVSGPGTPYPNIKVSLSLGGGFFCIHGWGILFTFLFNSHPINFSFIPFSAQSTVVLLYADLRGTIRRLRKVIDYNLF